MDIAIVKRHEGLIEVITNEGTLLLLREEYEKAMKRGSAMIGNRERIRKIMKRPFEKTA
ncbi:MAG: hypothetical protein JW884_11970 [Deltaproteobacteria bacterium]|nr:hypothetical protein [Deltaproteobacteria bacterium]